LHAGSARDLAVIAALLVTAKAFGGRFFPSRRVAGFVVALAAVTALGWPFLENGTDVAQSELWMSALWLFPVLCVTFLSIFAFAAVSIRVVRAIIKAAVVAFFPHRTPFVRCAFVAAPVHQQCEFITLLRRRGPPVLRVFFTLNT